MFSGSHKILLAIEQLLSMAEPILPDILTTCRLFRLSFDAADQHTLRIDVELM